MQPLAEQMEKLRVRSMVLRLVKTLPVTLPHTWEHSLRLDTLRIRHEEDGLLVEAAGTLPRDKVEGFQSRMDLFRDELEKEAGIPVTLEIEARQVDILLIRSVPDRDGVR
jgi:hypothetical protein